VGIHRRIIVIAAVLIGCRRTPSQNAPSPVASVPPDRLAPGEPAPGQQVAHDLVLPRGAKIERNFGNSIVAFVPWPAEKVANYVRTQTDATDLEAIVGPTGTVFPKVFVRGAKNDHWLRVEISRAERTDMSNVTIDRIENKPPPPKKSNEELMKEVGLTPDGKPLDPKHLE
jgi:hypothetical protein